MKVSNYSELMQAISSNEQTIELTASMSSPNGFSLNKGQKLVAAADNVFLSFINGDGIALAGDNEISGIGLQASPRNRALLH